MGVQGKSSNNPPAQGGAEGSLRLLLTKPPPPFLGQLPVAKGIWFEWFPRPGQVGPIRIR